MHFMFMIWRLPCCHDHIILRKKEKNRIPQCKPLLGGFIHILDIMELCMGPSPKNTEQQNNISKKSTNVFQHIEYNDVFLDVQKLQSAMVSFYRVKAVGAWKVLKFLWCVYFERHLVDLNVCIELTPFLFCLFRLQWKTCFGHQIVWRSERTQLACNKKNIYGGM